MSTLKAQVITLNVLSYNGSPLPQPLSARFDELGGTIGRADSNQLVLPDPERTISRVHAQVVFRNGAYAVVDRGSNPISVNGRPLGNGQESPLKHGDELQIGGYGIAVLASAANAPASASANPDPFADLGFAPPPPSAPVRAASPPSRGFDDPLAGFGAPPPPAAGFADPLGGFGGFGAAPPAPPVAAAGFGAPSPSAPASGIPDDWNPFAPDPKASAAASAPASRGAGNLGLDLGLAPAPLVPDMPPPSSESSLDALFGLGPTTGSDPLANSVLDNPAAQANMAADADPLRSLSSATRGTAQARADDMSELQRPFVMPGAPAPARSPSAPSFPEMPPASSPPAGMASAVLSWDDAGGGENRTVIRPKGTPAPAASPAPAPQMPAARVAAPAPPPVAAPVPAPAPFPAASSAPAPARPASPTRAMPSAGDADALLQAFREGLRMPDLAVELTPDSMRLIGELLHEATRGTVELLVARAALKREIRAEVTMIVAKENNPLKFSPSAEVALNHLLGPLTRGFMPPAPAMRDAYEDLRAHQFAFLAGMRAALDGVLQRFDPGVLEGKLTQKSVLATLLPASRKAKMWDVFQQLYAQISAEAADDFHELFGKAFLRAYEAHIDQLKKDAP